MVAFTWNRAAAPPSTPGRSLKTPWPARGLLAEPVAVLSVKLEALITSAWVPYTATPPPIMARFSSTSTDWNDRLALDSEASAPPAPSTALQLVIRTSRSLTLQLVQSTNTQPPDALGGATPSRSCRKRRLTVTPGSTCRTRDSAPAEMVHSALVAE